MTFYTSNYARNGSNPHAVAISYASDIPADWQGKTAPQLAPSAELLDAYHSRKINHDEYAAQYKALLESRGLTPESVTEKFETGTIFVCYDYEDGEASDGDADNGDTSVCHRFILAEWLGGYVAEI